MLDREAIERIMEGVPRLERAPGVGLRVVAAAKRHDPPAGPAPIAAPSVAAHPSAEGEGEAGAGIDSRACSTASTMSAWPSRRSTPRLKLYRDAFELALAHREVVQEQGVEAVLLDVGENHVELLAPLGADTPVGQVPGQATARGCTTSPTR